MLDECPLNKTLIRFHTLTPKMMTRQIIFMIRSHESSRGSLPTVVGVQDKIYMCKRLGESTFGKLT